MLTVFALAVLTLSNGFDDAPLRFLGTFPTIAECLAAGENLRTVPGAFRTEGTMVCLEVAPVPGG